MKRLKLIMAYVGTNYSGWQIQEKPDPPPTIQASLEMALAKITGMQIRAHASGRTDAGVHAHGQVVHCDVPDEKSNFDWRHRLNALLPMDIRIIQADLVHPHFHARKNALHKTYSYQFWQESGFVPPHIVPFVWVCGPLDTAAMRAALKHLMGRQDFSGLRNSGTDVESSIRTVLKATLQTQPLCEDYPPHAPMLRLTVTADGFLKQMVRNMAGLLVACGRGKMAPDSVPALLERHDRQAIPSVTAPPQGLTLLRVTYEGLENLLH